MSDTFRPFVVRRGISGDVTRAVAPWFSALRFGPKDYPFDIVTGATLEGGPWGYDQANIRVSVPPSVPSRGEMALVRGGFGHPTTPLDGETIWYNPDSKSTTTLVTEQINIEVNDTPLTQGRWYYYTLFVCVTDQLYPLPGEWMVAATGEVLVPRYYAHAEKLFAMIPPFYQRADDQQAANGRDGPLRRFVALLGYDADYNRTLLDGVLNVYHPDYSPLAFIEQVGANLGLPVENALGGARYRSIVGRLWDLDAMRGTEMGLESFVYAASNYQCDVVTGHNLLLTPDDSEFINGVGHWQPYSNAHVTDMTNVEPEPDIHPTQNDFPNLVLRPYTGAFVSGSATTLAIPNLPAGSGRGVLEVIDAPTGTPSYKDFEIVCGLSKTGNPVAGVSTDWQYYAIPVHKGEIWSLEFLCCHKSGHPDSAVIGSFVYYDIKGVYVGTTPGPIAPLVDNLTWQKYSFQFAFDNTYYVFPAVWWHHASTDLVSRYMAGVQMVRTEGIGAIAVVQPDIYLTLGTADPLKQLSNIHAHLGPPEAGQ